MRLSSATVALATASLASVSHGGSVGNKDHGKGCGSRSKSSPASPVMKNICNGGRYVYERLAGYGFVPANATDKYQDTISIGSAMAISDWQMTSDGKYTGVMWGLPDRGWNTKGTLNYQPRVHKLRIMFDPSGEPVDNVSGTRTNLNIEYEDTILLTGPDGVPVTGLDPDLTGGYEVAGFPLMPAATYPGDGFGGPGSGGRRLAMDPEGIFLTSSGGFWISDEYGPGVYQFDSSGKMVSALRAPDALIPHRNSSVSFSSANAPIHDPVREYEPERPNHGRNNNQGFEGLTVSPDGKTLYVLLQSAAMQEGGTDRSKRKNARFLVYDIGGDNDDDDDRDKTRTEVSDGELIAEYVVELPTYINAENETRVASQSEIHYVSETQFMILPRDSNAGRAQDETESKLRRVDVFDISEATDILGLYDGVTDSIETESKCSYPPECVCVCL